MFAFVLVCLIVAVAASGLAIFVDAKRIILLALALAELAPVLARLT